MFHQNTDIKINGVYNEEKFKFYDVARDVNV